MATPVLERFLTADEIVERQLGDGCEYINGEFVRRNVSLESSETAAMISFHLILHLRGRRLGTVIDSEQWMQFFPDAPNDLRRPDVAFLSRARRPGNVGVLRVPPELVIEVVSPGDTHREVRAKAGLWLRSGVLMVWLVWPDRREVDVYLPDGTVTNLKGEDIVEGGDAVPGFSCPIARFFERD